MMVKFSPNDEGSSLCRNRKSPTIMKQRARRLRREATETEAILWLALHDGQLGVKFRRQHAIKHFILDFYCP
jgi:very-short-patch-repair endonuclease